ncbi:ribosomal L1 domain-containing protein 1 isoform X2 [Salmo salar]|uniref:Ribosomal L1 domain-containing protein 1 isoform X2 n=1 Tax=Salmo salar TaxID=8030 RepID=A0ABM3E5D7_SALSA|nr:ribosomal L1 domain-containing protein 1 isoform X2 [Salmo salar]
MPRKNASKQKSAKKEQKPTEKNSGADGEEEVPIVTPRKRLNWREPYSLNLQSKKQALDIQRTIQGTTISISKKGCCCMACVAHSGMAADEIAENIDSAVSTIVTKLRMKEPLIKIIHLKSQSVDLPIYTSNLSNLTLIEETQKQTMAAMDAKKNARKQKSAKIEQMSRKKKTLVLTERKRFP